VVLAVAVVVPSLLVALASCLRLETKLTRARACAIRTQAEAGGGLVEWWGRQKALSARASRPVFVSL
jgi:hypothetical protein